MASSQADAAAAQEFLEYLKDLEDSKAYQIRLLTQMVNEQSDHAGAISSTLKDYISKAPPNRKLLALFVLDSIAKNLAGVFTQHLSKGLFDAYWDAYTRADTRSRAMMVSLLNSWENPGPGVSVRVPVFPVEVTRRIRDSLNAANAAIARRVGEPQQPVHSSHMYLQSHPLPPRPKSQTGPEQWRYPSAPQNASVTPIQQVPAYSSPPVGQQAGSYNQQYPPQVNMYTPSTLAQPPTMAHPVPSHLRYVDYHEVLGKLDHVVALLQYRCNVNPYDTEAQTKLAGITQLQAAVRNQPAIEPSVWTGIVHEVSNLSKTYGQPSMSNSNALQSRQQQTPTPQQLNQHHRAPPPLQSPPSQYIPPQSLDPNVIANLSSLIGIQPRSTPQPSSSSSLALKFTGNTTAVSKEDVINGTGSSSKWKPDLDFLSQLSKLTGAAAQTPSSNVPSQPGLNATQGFAGITALLGPKSDIRLTQASLRVSRPELMRSLWTGKTQCRTCGRRFATTDDGRERKKRHMDYHFRTKMRLSDTKQSAIATRSWFANELEWIRFREVDDAEAVIEGARDGSMHGLHGDGKEQTEETSPYVRVPSDVGKANRVCPICQDDFENTWHDAAQEWVWMDCVKGSDGRYYHNSCRQEVLKDEAAAKEREERARERKAREREAQAKVQRAEAIKTEAVPPLMTLPEAKSLSHSPDSVLGKRKAIEDEDDDDYEPSEHDRRVSPRVDAQA